MRSLYTLCLAALFVGCGGPSGQYVSAEEFGDDWPLTVSDGHVSCSGGRAFFEHGRTVYAVNGLAMSATDLPHVDILWANDPTMPGMKKNISPILNTALALCD